jgi:MYXO-CTERM domain-containing protein
LTVTLRAGSLPADGMGGFTIARYQDSPNSRIINLQSDSGVNGAFIDGFHTIIDPGLGAFHYTGTATAQKGLIGVSNELDIDPGGYFPSSSPPDLGLDTIALYTTYVIFSGPGETVDTSFNAFVSGHVDASGCFLCSNTYRVSTALGLSTLDLTFGDSFGSIPVDYTRVITSQTMNVQVGVPVPVSFQLELISGILPFSIGIDNYVNSADFLHTLTFASGQVFNLPDGFTVNGTCIADNVSICTESSAATPEPGSLMLGAAGLGAIFAVVRKRRLSA